MLCRETSAPPEHPHVPLPLPRQAMALIHPQIYLLCSILIPNPRGAQDALSLAPTSPPVLRNALRWCRFGGLLPVRGEVGLMESPFF